MPSGFTALSICNVRCFGPEQILQLATPEGNPARWTVLLGENGVGKTTLLQALALVSMEGPELLFDERWDWDPYYAERDWPGLGRSADGRGFVRGFVRAPGATTAREHAVEISSDWPFDVARHPGPPDLFVCGYGASRRLGGGKLRRARREGRASVASLFYDAPLRDGEEWMLQADYAAAKEGSKRTDRDLELVTRLLLSVLPETTAIRLGRHARRGLPAVELKTPYGWVPMRGLSLGYQTLIAWMIDLASRFFERFPKSKAPLEEPAIVLVDEIDLHLHPRWQRALIADLTERFPQTQFVATAHSPLVVQAAAGANVAVLKRTGDHVTIDSQPESVRNWRVDQILTSDLYGLPSARPPHLDALLEQRRKLLTKPTITAADRRKLRALEEKIGELPGGETPEQQRAMELITLAAERLGAAKSRKK